MRILYCGGKLFPSLGDLPDPGIEPSSPVLQVDSLPSEPELLKEPAILGFQGGARGKEPTYQRRRCEALGWEDSREEGMATHSSILAWRIPWTEQPGRLQSIVWQRVRHD